MKFYKNKCVLTLQSVALTVLELLATNAQKI